MSFGVVFLASLRPGARAADVKRISTALGELAADGWMLNPHQAAGRAAPGEPRCYWSAPYQRFDAFGLLEAPDADRGHEGIALLLDRGWGGLFGDTMWITGPRDLAPTPGAGPHDPAVGFLALWDWNDGWHAASPPERAEYDAECDVAFRFDVSLGIDLFGRFRTAAASGWEQTALWECPDLETLTRAMGSHEVQRDFVFTTSSHFIGRAIAFDDLGRSLS